MLGAVDVAVDDAFDAFGFGVGPEAPVEVEPVGAGVEFDPGAGLGAGVYDGALVEFVGVALEQEQTRIRTAYLRSITLPAFASMVTDAKADSKPLPSRPASPEKISLVCSPVGTDLKILVPSCTVFGDRICTSHSA